VISILQNNHETKHLRLRALCTADTAAVFNFYASTEMMSWRGAPVFTQLSEAEKLMFEWRRLQAQQTGFRLGIGLRETDELIGTAGLKNISTQHCSAEIGYELQPEFWNRGYMTEALQPMLSFVFDELQLHTITANIDPNHIASKRVLEKLGFVQEALFRENYFFERWWDSAIWVKQR
jgi:[ribosomal protein S5]-alanine N-acetyltransferase